jgi:hypothetical protein
MAQYTATGIIFAKITPQNLLVAQSATGGVESDITDRINPVTLAQGVITTTKAALTGTFASVTNSNEINGSGTNFDGAGGQLSVGDRLYFLDGSIYKFVGTIASIQSDTKATLVEAAPVNTPTAGDALAINTNVVTGVNTNFTTDFAAGEYLFYFDAGGTPILVGKIATVSSAQIVLTSFLIRIPVVANSGGVFLPNWNNFRIPPPTITSYNDTNVASISTYSTVGNPAVIGSVTQAPFALRPSNVFPTTTIELGQKVLWFQPTPAFPNFVFAIVDPYGEQAGVNLAQNTMYQFACADVLDGFLAGANTPVFTMLNNGYSPTQFI